MEGSVARATGVGIREYSPELSVRFDSDRHLQGQPKAGPVTDDGRNKVLLNRFLQSAAGFELGRLGCWDLNGLTGPGISARSRFSLGH